MKPMIAIVLERSPIESGPFVGADQVHVPLPYITAVLACGGVPVALPLVSEPDDLRRQLSMCDGLLLPGGSDIDALLYGEQPHARQGYFDRALDRYYLDAIRMASDLGLPMLGICKGCQAIAVALGGALFQDIPSQKEGALLHDQNAPLTALCHTVEIVPGSFLSALVPERIEVNSFHHQAVKRLPDVLTPAAISPDGVIEAFEAADGRPIYGVQWHPELTHMAGDAPSDAIFAHFVAQCRNTRQTP